MLMRVVSSLEENLGIALNLYLLLKSKDLSPSSHVGKFVIITISPPARVCANNLFSVGERAVRTRWVFN